MVEMQQVVMYTAVQNSSCWTFLMLNDYRSDSSSLHNN